MIKSNFVFESPKNYKFIIFDDTGQEVLTKILPEKKSFILATRAENFKTIYLSPKIIFFLLVNIFKRSLKINYLIILIRIIKPNKIVTIIDNYEEFYAVYNSLRSSNIKFYAFQNAYRHESYLKEILLNTNYKGHYFSFGQYEINSIRKNIKIEPMLKDVGSLRAAVAKEYLFKKYGLIKKKYDICLISEATYDFDGNTIVKNFDYLSFVKKLTKLASFCKKFSEENKKKFLLLGRADENDPHKNIEKKFYNFFSNNNNFEIKFVKKKEFESFLNVIESELIIATHSTFLREVFAFETKALVCNWLDYKEFEFPSEGICKLQSENYADFNQRVKSLLEMKYEDYLKNIKNLENTYNKNLDTLGFFRSEISKI